MSKVKCKRCLDLMELDRYIKRSEKEREKAVSRSYGYVSWLDIKIEELERKAVVLRLGECLCVECEQGQLLPSSNTGVKISAFSEGIAQKTVNK